MRAIVPVVSDREPYVISPHFGRSPYFALVDIKNDEHEVEVFENPALRGGGGRLAHGGGGHGRLIVSFISSLNVKAVIVRSIGYRAFYHLRDLGIKVYETSERYLSEAIEKFKRGELRESKGPSRQHG